MPDLRVTIAQGELEGCSFTTEEGFEFNGYMGIPYAKPPIGELRFRDPLPAEGWSGIRDATKEGQVCSQLDRIFTQQFMGDEDGLFLNIFTPASANEGHNLPVMFWIHGGAFSMGSGNKVISGPDYLVEKNVIVVSINYRLGPLGFLCLHTPEVPGNAGLKDQILALKWVQNNISKFGGDRDNVTIFGESAGSASVHYSMMTETGVGLFQRAIMQSGSCLNNWCCQSEPEESAIQLAKNLGYESNDMNEILKFLRTVPAKELILMSDENFKLTDPLNFTPVLEKQHPGVEAYITTHPLELMISGKYNSVPIIKGFNSQEGALFITKTILGDVDVSSFTKFEDFQFDITNFLPSAISELQPEMQKAIIDKIKKFFFTGKHLAEGVIDLMSDLSFVIDIDKSVKLLCKESPVYYYLFDYNGGLNLLKTMIDYPYTGASHADEIPYIFKPDIYELITMKNDPQVTDITISPNDILTLRRMVEMWTNFAKVGNPTPKIDDVITTEWKPVTETEVNCLEIGKDLKMIKDPFADRINFWKQLFPKSQ